ncbi:MAG: cbb3-type cytochrome c oxidase subunit I [candidate division NC10 bacterium]
MDRINVWFVRASLVYLLVGTFLGLLIAVQPSLVVQLRIAHVHLNLAGFMTMMIFGVGHHIFPRFSGRPLYSRRLVTATFWLGNVGVVGLTLGFVLGVPGVVTAFGVMAFLAVVAFVVNLLCTFAASAAPGTGCSGRVPVLPISIRPGGDG